MNLRFGLFLVLTTFYLSTLVLSHEIGEKKWSFQTEGKVISSPSLGFDETIYIGSTDKKLYALNPDGTLKWTFKTGDMIVSSPAVGFDGTIYIGSLNNKLYALNPDGTSKWSYKTSDDISSSPAISSDGTIYINTRDGNLYAFNPDGSLLWLYETGFIGNSSSPVIGSDGTIYVCFQSGEIFAFNTDGTIKWQLSTRTIIMSSPAIGAEGIIYIGTNDDIFYAISPDGKIKWMFSRDSNISDMFKSSPVIGEDGTIYIGSDANYLYAINPDGTLKWSFRTDDDISSSPVIGLDGTIYIGSNDNTLYAIDPQGKHVWTLSVSWIGYAITSSPVIGSDGTLYVGALDNYIHAIQTGSFGLANSMWPKFHQNNQNQGHFDAIAPAAISDLQITSKADSTITLAWTASGDDNSVGKAKLYDLRYQTYSIQADTISWWNEATQVIDEPLPVFAGEQQTIAIGSLDSTFHYYFIMRVIDDAGNWSAYSNLAEAIVPESGINDGQAVLPRQFVLHQNYPNPFNPTTIIPYSLPENCQVTIIIYNALGREVYNLVNTKQSAGHYKVEWDGRNNQGTVVPTGMYFVRMETDEFKATRKVLFLR